MTFTALGGCSIGCVRFLGITSFPMNEFESVVPSSHLSNYEDELFLVFERASKGSLPEFMERELQGTTGTKSWIIVLETLVQLPVVSPTFTSMELFMGRSDHLCTAYALTRYSK
jgi:hypothetical protein